MYCFTILDMHFGWGLSSFHDALWVIGLSGFCAGLLNAWRWTDIAFVAMTMLLLALSLYLFLGQVVWESNPPYCWGDVFGVEEMKATTKPTLKERLPAMMGWAFALFVGSFLLSTGLKHIRVRSRASS